jgi:PAS domain S-box-containing protein
LPKPSQDCLAETAGSEQRWADERLDGVSLGSRVLVMIEDTTSSEHILELLRQEGFGASVTSVVDEAVASVQGGSIDLLLLDMPTSEATGLALLHQLDNKGLLAGLGVLVAVDRADLSPVVAAMAAGASDFVTRPFHGSELAVRLRAAFNSRALEGAFRTSREWLDAILAATGSVACALSADQARAVHSVSGDAELILGYSPEQMATPGFSVEMLVHPDDRAQFVVDLGIASIVGHGVADYRSLDSDGLARWLRISLHPTPGSDGRQTTILAVIWDVTAERETRRTLQTLRGEAQVKKEALADVGLEFRTSLNSVIGFAQLLEADDLTEEQRDSVSQIIRAGRDLLGLTNEVLESDESDAGKLRLSLEPVNVYELMDSAAHLTGSSTEEGWRRIRIDRPIEDLYAFADSQRLMQVVLGLFSEMTARGGRETEFSVSFATSGPQVQIIISDDEAAKGAEAAQLGSADRRISDDEHGGLGTSSRALIERMGGALETRGALGEGPLHVIGLPASTLQLPKVDHERDDSARASTVSTDLRILYIEDDPASATLIERAAQRIDGVKLVTASLGQLGIDLAASSRFDAVFLDLHLPDMEGDQVLEQLKKSPITASTPVIICSGEISLDTQRRLIEEGAAAYMTKPIDLGVFNELVSRLQHEQPITPQLSSTAPRWGSTS